MSGDQEPGPEEAGSVVAGPGDGVVPHGPAGGAVDPGPAGRAPAAGDVVPTAAARAGADLARAALDRAKEEARQRSAQPRSSSRRRSPARARSSGLSGPGPDARDPQPFGAAIRGLFAERGWEQTAKNAQVMGAWDRLVGPELAAHCRPESLRDGELVLVAESTAWATQVRLLARTLVTRLSAELGPGVVSRVRVHGPTAPSWQRGPRRVLGRGPRDTYG